MLISGIMLATLGHRGETLQNKKELSDVKSVSSKIQSQVCSVNAIFRNETGSLGALLYGKARTTCSVGEELVLYSACYHLH